MLNDAMAACWRRATNGDNVDAQSETFALDQRHRITGDAGVGGVTDEHITPRIDRRAKPATALSLA